MTMKSAWKLGVLLPLVLLALGASGCDRLLRASGIRSGEPPVAEDPNAGVGQQTLSNTEAGQLLENPEAGIQITLPATWQEDDRLHPSAELQASDPTNQLYLIVVAEEDETLARFGLPENSQRYRNLLANSLRSLDSQSATDVVFVGQDFASQYEVRGQLDDGSPVVYLHTTVVSGPRYYQIVGWTTPEQYGFYKSELQGITETFREITDDAR